MKHSGYWTRPSPRSNLILYGSINLSNDFFQSDNSKAIYDLKWYNLNDDCPETVEKRPILSGSLYIRISFHVDHKILARKFTGMSRLESAVEALVTRPLDRPIFQSGLTRLQFPAALN